MRDYAKVAPQFWTGETGKAIRALGRDEQVIALYLLTCPSSNALGLYYLPIPTMCHETGCPIKGASKALLRVCEAGFASYDAETEHVFVHRMAEYQIGAALLPADKRIPWIKKELQAYKNTPYFNVFVERYKEAFHLHELDGLGRGIEAPSKPVVRAGAGAVAGAGAGKKPSSEVKPSDAAFGLSEFFLSELQARFPNFKTPNMAGWARDCDLLLRLDKRDLKEAEELIRWMAGDFWGKVVLCPAKLREKWDQIQAKRAGANSAAAACSVAQRDKYAHLEETA
jgi:hypothetical protein